MRKIVLLVGMFTVLSLIVAACSSSGSQNGTAAPGSTSSVTEGAGGLGSTETFTGTASTQSPGLGTSTVETPAGTATQALSTSAAPTAATMPPISSTQAVTPTQSGGLSATQVVSGTAQLPGTGAGAEAKLSTMFGMSVVNQNGDVLGTSNDYILNLCEAHILYIVLRPTASLGFASGENILIPYEALSVNNGQIDAGQRRLTVNLSTEELKLAPAFTQADLDLSTADWEPQVMTYWSGTFKTSLTTECKVQAPEAGGQLFPIGTPYPTLQSTGVITMSQTAMNTQATPAATQNLVAVHKIAYARDVLAAEVQDGNGIPLGQVEEVLVTPETGRLDYVAVRLDSSISSDSKLVLVPLRALNLKEPGARPVVLVLLVDTNVLQNAPALDELSNEASLGAGSDVFDYWTQYVEMKGEGQ